MKKVSNCHLKSKPIEKVDDNLRRLLDDMLDTMYAAPGIGLAAVQVGILKRIIVIDISKEKEKKNPFFLINPEIIFKSEKTSSYEEGCLSLPGHFAEIERPALCLVKFLDYVESFKDIWICKRKDIAEYWYSNFNNES